MYLCFNRPRNLFNLILVTYLIMENTNNSAFQNDKVFQLLQKENEALRKVVKEKIVNNDTLNTLMDLLEIQRDRINFLEEGKDNLNISS